MQLRVGNMLPDQHSRVEQTICNVFAEFSGEVDREKYLDSVWRQEWGGCEGVKRDGV